MINNQYSPFGAKICSDICPRTFSVPRNELFFESKARGNTVNVQKEIYEHMETNCHPSNIFCIIPSFSWGIFSHVTYLDKSHASWKYLMDYNIADNNSSVLHRQFNKLHLNCHVSCFLNSAFFYYPVLIKRKTLWTVRDSQWMIMKLPIP